MATKNGDGTTKTTRRASLVRRSLQGLGGRSRPRRRPTLPTCRRRRSHSGRLQSVITEVDKVVTDQSAFQASKQMASQRLQALVDQGDKLTTVLKTIIRQHYGNGSDKLVEFGIQPLRARPKPQWCRPRRRRLVRRARHTCTHGDHHSHRYSPSTK